MVPLIVIRPEPGNSATLGAARRAGIVARGHPLFAVEPRRWEVPAAADFDAVLAGSANAFRHGGTGLKMLTGLPVYAVGKATAAAAHAAGFAVAATGTGGLQALLDTLPALPRRLLRLAGEQRTPLAAPAGVAISERVIYASRPVPMPAALAALLARPAVIALHSARAARHFAAECANRAVARGPLRIAALAPRVAEAAGRGWGGIAVATAPDDAALLALARQMCQDRNP